MSLNRFRPGLLKERIHAAGASYRQVSRETGLSLFTIVSAVKGNPCNPQTVARLGAWLRGHPPIYDPGVEGLLDEERPVAAAR